MDWLAPDKYRRVISSQEFSQTLIVDGTRVSEVDSTNYFPLTLRTLTTAVVDPRPILAAVRDGDRVATKANGAVNESGLTCFNASKTLCGMDKNGMRETVAASGHAVDFSKYEAFHGRQVARVISNAPRLGEELTTLTVTKLADLKSPDETLLTVTTETPADKVLRFAPLSDADLRVDVAGTSEIIWPQPLDGAETGPASFYVSFDTTGKVREVLQLYTANERTNDSAKSQLEKWTFRPAMVNGLPAQGEGVLSFTLNTRKYGPKEPLRDEEARKLAKDIVEPEVAPGKYPSGTVYTLWASVDSEGRLIEVMAGDGPHELFMPCYHALQAWHFEPILEGGKAMPYRANIVFKMP
jgi:hypothetical protein